MAVYIVACMPSATMLASVMIMAVYPDFGHDDLPATPSEMCSSGVC